MQRLRVRTKAQRDEYEIQIGRGILKSIGETARSWLKDDVRQIAVISNPKIFSLYGQDVVLSLRASGFVVSQKLVGDGERFKSLKTLQTILVFLNDNKFERSDALLALGGGVIGDLAGFASSIYLRGLPVLFAPTTLLAQIDSSVGGKTGVNLPSGKNLVGTFHQPAGVLSDVNTLKTLPKREVTSGCCEIVKQGVISSRRLFDQTMNALRNLNSNADDLSSVEIEELIAAHCAFKASVVRNDEREAHHRTDRHSRRILNFGHTAGHAIESVTSYRRFRHGEAVGIGMIIAGLLSRNLGLLADDEFELLTEAIELCGKLPATDDLDSAQVLKSIVHDKKKVAGSIQWVLLEGIGKPRIISDEEIDPRLIKQSVREGLSKRRK